MQKVINSACRIYITRGSSDDGIDLAASLDVLQEGSHFCD